MKLQVPVGVSVSLPRNTARACCCFERYKAAACVSFFCLQVCGRCHLICDPRWLEQLNVKWIWKFVLLSWANFAQILCSDTERASYENQQLEEVDKHWLKVWNLKSFWLKFCVCCFRELGHFYGRFKYFYICTPSKSTWLPKNDDWLGYILELEGFTKNK